MLILCSIEKFLLSLVSVPVVEFGVWWQLQGRWERLRPDPSFLSQSLFPSLFRFFVFVKSKKECVAPIMPQIHGFCWPTYFTPPSSGVYGGLSLLCCSSRSPRVDHVPRHALLSPCEV